MSGLSFAMDGNLAADTSRRAVLVGLAAGSVTAGVPMFANVSSFNVADPLLDAIQALYDGEVAFEAIHSNDWDSHGGEEAVVAKTYLPPHEALERWDQPAATRRGAVEAIRLALREEQTF
ncbi:hypothetical protein GR156_22760, partial [Shinella zoogloeoides]|nr:hypothetical protein [Shinella zoogloeoides]